MDGKVVLEGLTYDDILLVPQASAVLPREVDISTQLTKNIRLNIPLISAAMDTVTEASLAIAIAREGGLGIIHKNMSPERQAAEVDKVKRSESGMIMDPITLAPNQTIGEAHEMMHQFRISGIPIVDGSKLVGILTNRDLRFVTDNAIVISDVMTHAPLITAKVGTTLEEAELVLQKYKIEKLLIVNGKNELKGLITVKDIQKKKQHPNAAKDEHGRLRVGAAIGASPDNLARVKLLVEKDVDVIVVDSAHGHHQGILNTIRIVKKAYPDLDIIGGNVATYEGAKALIEAGVDAVKVGVGPGAICTTRVVTGVGVPQVTAIMECSRACREGGVGLIADGGIKLTGDIPKAIAAGADTVMIGSLFAGTTESPGEMIFYEGRSFKVYRGMGSIGAMKEGSSDRYFQEGTNNTKKLVPEGIEGRVPYRGALNESVFQMLGGLRAAMGYCGSPTVPVLKEKGKFVKITLAGLKESHPHDIKITKESPNYSMEN